MTANKNYIDLLKQAKIFKVVNIIITMLMPTIKLKIALKINIYNSFDNFNNIFSSKINFVMSSIVGLDGLIPTFKIIKFTKKIAIANKNLLFVHGIY